MNRKWNCAIAMALVVMMMITALPIASFAEEKLEPITFTVYAGGSNPGTFDEDACHQYIREELGINFQYLWPATDNQTAVNLMLVGEDYPDAIRFKWGPEITSFVTGGHVVDLTEYIHTYAPRLVGLMESNERVFKFNIPDFSEELWYIPSQLGIEEYPNIEPTIGVRFDVWKKVAENMADLPKPKDLDEFYELLKAMVAAQPESEGKKAYAISGWLADNWGGQWLIWSYLRLAGSYQWLGTAVEADAFQRKYCIDSEEWLWAMRFLNRAYRDGIADPEAVTMNQEAYNKKLAQGLIYTTPYSGFWLDGVANTARAAAGYPEQILVPYSWMSYPESSGITGSSVTGGYDPSGIHKTLITKNCKNPEEVFKRLAWLMTEEGIVFQGMGIQGVHWDYDEDGFRKPKDEIIEMYLNDPDFTHKTGIGKYRLFSDYFYGCDANGDAYNIEENKYILARKEDAYVREYKDFLGLNPNLSVEASAARAGGVQDEALWVGDLGTVDNEYQDIEAQLNALEAEYIGKLYSAKDDATFDALLAEWRIKAEGANYMRYYDHINPQIQERYTNFKNQ